MTWLLFALLAAFFFGLSRVAARSVLKKHGNPLAFTALHNFFAGIILMPILFFDLQLPKHNTTWILFIFVVVFGLLSDWFAYKSLKRIEVSVYQIVSQIRHVLVLLGGFIIFLEIMSLEKICAVTLIMTGVIIIVYEKGKLRWSKGIIFALLNTLCAVFAFFLIKLTLLDFSSSALASIELILISLISFALIKFDKGKILKQWETNKLGLIIAGVLFGLFDMFLFLALKYGDISKVIPISQSSLVFGVLLGIILLKEKERLSQKVIGTLIIVLGIVLINIF